VGGVVKTHQNHVIVFFMENSDHFLKWMSSLSDGDCVIIEDFVPIAVTFIDNMLRIEKDLYDCKSARYHYLIDMLIEINQRLDEPFREQLCLTATDIVLSRENLLN
jgi:hypothetical protein